MIKSMFAAIAAMVAFTTAPAMADDFAGARVGVTAGLDRQAHQNGLQVGAVAGYDVKVAGPIRLGVEATIAESTTDFFGAVHSNFDLGVNARLGVKVVGPVLAFGKIGYARTDYGLLGTTLTQQGLRYGGGVEVAVTDHVYATAEYVRTNYGTDAFVGRPPARDLIQVGAGLRF